MLTKLALIGPPGLCQRHLRSALSRPLLYNVREFQSLSDVQHGLAKFPFDVLITRLPTFEMCHVATIQKLQSAFPKAGLVTMSRSIDANARFAVRSIVKHALVDEELEFSDLDQLIIKVQKAHERSVSTARLHVRAKRDDTAVLITTDDVYQEDFFHEMKFVDFARMGAKLEVHSAGDLKLQPKSRVELRYQSSEDRKKIHRLEARVVWIKKTGSFGSMLAGPKTTVGLRFIAEL